MDQGPGKSVGEGSPRPSSEIREQLAEFAVVRASAERHGVLDHASRIGMQSILIHEASLRAELKSAEQQESNAGIGESHDCFRSDPRRSPRIVHGVLVGGNSPPGFSRLMIGDRTIIIKSSRGASKDLKSIPPGAGVEAVVRRKRPRRRGKDSSPPTTTYRLMSIKKVSGN